MRTRNSGTGQAEGSGRSFDSVRGNVPASFAIFVLTMVAAVGCYILYMDTFALPPQPSFSPPFDGYSTAPMQRAIGPDEVGRQQERILDLGSRFPGHPGFYATEDYLKKSFEDAGLEIFEQEISILTPRTRYREL